jgi:hypothetical protein
MNVEIRRQNIIILFWKYQGRTVSFLEIHISEPWMKEVRDKTWGRGAYLRCPVFTTVHFSLHDEGSSEYIRVCEGRESLRPNFKLLRTPAIDSIDSLKGQ